MDPIMLRARDTPAVVTEDGAVVTHRELRTLVDAFASRLAGGQRRLVGMVGDRELGTVVAHLAALYDGHAVAWFGAAGVPERMRELVRRYAPEFLVGPIGTMAAVAEPLGYRLESFTVAADVVVARAPQPSTLPIGTDTSLLLLTSGSVSGGRGVRLSAGAIAANARGIRETLEFDSTSRGATSLPLYYSYGLSILHSHLSAGGSVLLTSAPATGGGFWNRFDTAGCHVFNGVPTHFEWLDRKSVPWQRVRSLRTITCAGGPIARSLAERMHQRCARIGAGFVKMYGQTEATARISILRAEDFLAHPDSVGRVLPGSRVSFDAEGQLLYHGPSSMLGYCDGRADLAAPDQMRGTIHTGDVGHEMDGYIHLTGRMARFIKPNGRRISLDSVEGAFAELVPAAAVGDAEEQAHVFVTAEYGPALEAVRRELLDRLGLPPAAISLHCATDLPRRSNGKLDYQRLVGRVAAMTAERQGR
ncbi:AMP-binding protein [Nocardia barduliensis]|uniref:AMP-binding protein n=1 Tax=Nocardia barduliensis TaxID=2736643 RepID=UPI00157444A7|nr:AMP-binding protein [Nocardia barduliensis]